MPLRRASRRDLDPLENRLAPLPFSGPRPSRESAGTPPGHPSRGGTPPAATAIGYGLSPAGRRLATALPTAALVAFQSFRLPLELVLHRWAEIGTIPGTMTWTGQNLDVVSGVSALVAAPLAGRSRAAAWTFDVVGTLLLLNVARVAIRSMPGPLSWGVEPPLLVALHLPYALIVPVCVAAAIAGHVVLTRRLLLGART